MEYNVVIVGSGLAGSTSARMLAEEGYKVLVIEREKNLGGQCYDYKNHDGITIHKFGPHIFHTNDKLVWDFVSRFSRFNIFQHRVLSYVEGNMIEFPINRITINKIFGENLSDDKIAPFLTEEVKKSKYNTPYLSFRDAVVGQVGERLYSLFFENYTKKQWETNPENLSPELATRIPVRNNSDSRYFTDIYQGIPSHGYSEMITNMLDHNNIHILSGCDYFEKKDLFNSSLLIYTGQLDRFFNYKYGELEYRSVRIEFETLNLKQFQPAPVVNYPNDYDWTRITEYKQLTGDKSDKTTISYEYPQSKGHAFYTVPTKVNMERRKMYMENVEQLESAGKHLFLGRLAEYKYYNMDNVIAVTIHKINKWLNSKR